MTDLLKFEADCMTIHIIYHSLDNPELNTQSARESDRKNMCPTFGHLYPGCEREIHKAYNLDTLRDAVKVYEEYRKILENVPNPEKEEEMGDATGKSLDDVVYAELVKRYTLAYEQ